MTTSVPVPPIELVALDMAGTTVADDGAAEDAFTRAVEAMIGWLGGPAGRVAGRTGSIARSGPVGVARQGEAE